MSGAATRLNELKALVNRDGSLAGEDVSTEEWTGLVKAFLREMPEPLLTIRLCVLSGRAGVCRGAVASAGAAWTRGAVALVCLLAHAS